MKDHLSNSIVLTLALIGGISVAAASEPRPENPQDRYCFKRHVIDNTEAGADGVHLGDINGDGYPDVVAAWEESAVLKLYFHPGEILGTRPANWQAVDISSGSTVNAIEDAAFIDMDDDGKVDSILSATEGEHVDSNRRIRLHHTSANKPNALKDAIWHSTVIHADQPTERFMKVRGAQLDNQHGADIVALSRDLFENPEDPNEITTHGGVFLFTSPAPEHIDQPSAWNRQRLADVHKGKSIELLDMDGDQDLDILYSGARNIVWLENPLIEGQSADWVSHWIGAASDLALCDINADGVRDIVATASKKEYPVIAHWFEGKGPNVKRKRAWTSHAIRLGNKLPNKFYQPNNFAIKSIACAGLSTDSTPDAPASIVITTSGSGFGIVLAVAPEDFATDYTRPWHGLPVTDYRWVTKYDNILAADLDTDGDTDLLTSEENEGFLFRGAGVLWYERRSCD